MYIPHCQQHEVKGQNKILNQDRFTNSFIIELYVPHNLILLFLRNVTIPKATILIKFKSKRKIFESNDISLMCAQFNTSRKCSPQQDMLSWCISHDIPSNPGTHMEIRTSCKQFVPQPFLCNQCRDFQNTSRLQCNQNQNIMMGPSAFLQGQVDTQRFFNTCTLRYNKQKLYCKVFLKLIQYVIYKS